MVNYKNSIYWKIRYAELLTYFYGTNSVVVLSPDCTLKWKPGVMFLILCFLFSGAPTFYMKDSTSNFGILHSTTELICEDSSILPTSLFAIAKNGMNIFTHSGEISTYGKYNATPANGTIVLKIYNTEISDEADYTCSVNKAGRDVYTLKVEGKY